MFVALVTLPVLKFMFRFFRKHNWILIVALSLTIISFVFFMGSGPFAHGRRWRRGRVIWVQSTEKKSRRHDYHACDKK